MTHKKVWLLALALLPLVFALSACSGADTPEAQEPETAEEGAVVEQEAPTAIEAAPVPTEEEATVAADAAGKPEAVEALEAAYGPPSDAGFGSAVFYEELAPDADLERAALEKYKAFVGKLWDEYGEDAWMGPWTAVYTRAPETEHDIVAELQGVTDATAGLSVPMVLEPSEGADQAREALAAVFDDPGMSEVSVYDTGDGGAMSGILVAGRNPETGQAVFLVFLYD